MELSLKQQINLLTQAWRQVHSTRVQATIFLLDRSKDGVRAEALVHGL